LLSHSDQLTLVCFELYFSLTQKDQFGCIIRHESTTVITDDFARYTKQTFTWNTSCWKSQVYTSYCSQTDKPPFVLSSHSNGSSVLVQSLAQNKIFNYHQLWRILKIWPKSEIHQNLARASFWKNCRFRLELDSEPNMGI